MTTLAMTNAQVAHPNIATLPGVNPHLPPSLGPLVEVAYNFHWSTSSLAMGLFERLDPVLWDETGHNPVKVLATISPSRLEALALDDKLVAMVKAAQAELRAHLADPGWYAGRAESVEAEAGGTALGVAYFCAEFGLHECFQIYSGGLGLLAGDHLKSASDLGLPLVGVGLLYRNGYFHQKLDAGGYQTEQFPPLDAPRQPVRRVMDLENGKQLTVTVHLPGRDVRVAVWRADVGKVRLYLLDTNIPDNAPEDREITANLYLGDQNRRIQQEIVLGIGGVRALDAAGERPTVFHMNEGHAGFLALERIRAAREGTGLTFDQAREGVAAGHVFTTHTPVPAGIDRFPPGLVQHYFGTYAASLGLDLEGLLALGREDVANRAEAFSMAVMAIRCSRWCNGVSRLHGEVSRRMWRGIWPETPEADVPIGHVTNGVHTPTWLSPRMAEVYDRRLGPAWRARPQDPAAWAGMAGVPDAELWGARNDSRRAFVEYCARCAGLGRTGGVRAALDPDVLTIGFARRFAGYKRGTLLLRDKERLARLLRGAGGRGMQVVLSGKAHPGDGWGKDLIRDVVEFARSEAAGGRVLFIEDYGIDVAREMVRGCDVWLNTPIRGLEASGTSGMKAAVNGVLHASILDGWWDEGYAPAAGFKIEDSGIYPSDAPDEAREAAESDALYRLLETGVAPDFYDRGPDGVPSRWAAKMRACVRTLAPEFSTGRMVAEYAEKYYFPAHRAAARLTADGFGPARGLADQIDRYRRLWHPVRVKHVECAAAPGGEGVAVAASVRLGTLRPDEVRVEAYHGPVEASGTIERGAGVPMTCRAPLPGGDGTYHYTARLGAGGSPGRHHGVMVRVLPGDERLVTPFVPGLIVSSGVVVAEGEVGGGV
jgi:starch phosphorylase